MANETTTIEQLEAQIAAHEKREEDLITKYGPGTKFNRTIQKGSLDWDAEAKKLHVTIECEVCGTPVKVFTSDLFQKGKCEDHAKEARAARRKGKAKVNDNINLTDAKAKLAALKAKMSTPLPTGE